MTTLRILSDKELKVIQLLCEGLSNHIVAERLKMEPDRVEALINRIFKKTQTTSWAELVIFALRNKIYNLSYDIAI
jgi:DNA-binding NarL/FixJ family response regulator